jgi:hypothetical protein
MLGINLDKLIAIALETIDTLGSGAAGYRQRTGNSPSHRQSAQIGPNAGNVRTAYPKLAAAISGMLGDLPGLIPPDRRDPAQLLDGSSQKG